MTNNETMKNTALVIMQDMNEKREGGIIGDKSRRNWERECVCERVKKKHLDFSFQFFQLFVLFHFFLHHSSVTVSGD